MLNKEITIFPQKGVLFDKVIINIGDKISNVINNIGSYDTARKNEYYFPQDGIIHVVTDDDGIVDEIEISNDDSYAVYLENICISLMEREQLINYLTRLNGGNSNVDEEDSYDFYNLRLRLWYESNIEDAQLVIAEQKKEGIFTREDEEYEMKLANFFGSVVIY